MGFLLLLVLCAFTGPVFGDNKPKICTELRQFYSSKGFSPNGVPSTELSGEHLGVCPQSYTCCTTGMEENLLNLSRRELETQVKESGRTLQASISGQYKSFDEYFLQLLNRSEGSLQSSFQTGFGPLYSQVAKGFQDLYSDLRRYYRGTKVNLEEALNEFWARLLERLFKALNPQYSIGEEYLECVAKQSETLKPFGDTPKELKTKLMRAVIAARTFLQGLVTSGEALRKVSQVSLSTECVRAVMKMTYCPHCNGVAFAKPCSNYCKNVMKGCLANQADLDSEWRNLADTMLQVVDKLSRPYSVDSVILSLPKRVAEAILYMQDNLNTFNDKVFQACGSPVLSSIPENQIKRGRNAAEEVSSTPGFHLEKVLSDVSRMLRDVMQYWILLPSKLCVDRESGPSEVDTCWNGIKVNRYLPEVMGDGLANQINNPEVETDITKPDMTVRKQIMQLKIMINRLKYAINGNDVDFQDSSDDISGSGSGMCPEDQCPHNPRLAVPNADRPKVYAYPSENKKVVNGRSSQNLPCISLYLLSLVTVLLRR
ncbi:Glypican-1 Secreted glypican-1 [Triplophysa tibetana]|uniref:Glypican-1 n=1 Tax=Triplophysa tibetana TaxID=1572043 RepID=A0A5A9PBW9_9TELE|nr:Glypican-1 Secreted glypican-1 [Triplophysa tibetana]